ncbi:enoyl-CoA hydratase [Roseomonas sp. 18066]|uniref:enoyl-CoA hydratase n=1 Tax=Roseomonas sp. 18066 TaxID=2681412 RepID=UPI00135A54A9|nr:enoyl-CoA hydratase [Roseomonas sp. 18066]
MSEGLIRHARDEQGIARVTIDRPAKLNAMTEAMFLQVAAVVGGYADDPGLRGLVLQGAGDRAFVGGADIGVMAGLSGPEEARRFIEAVHAACRALRDLPVPAIARIQGLALGAGLELAAACDLRIASHAAHLGMPEVVVGIPSVVEASLLPGLIGWGRTRRLLLLGETITGEEAERWGLVERCVAPEALDAALEEWIALLLKTGPAAIRSQKALLRQWESMTPDAGAEASIPVFAAAFEGDEPARMLGAFVARKRK